MGKLINPSWIVIHHSLTVDGKTLSWDNIRKNHIQVNGWDDIGYHFGIEETEGEVAILTGRPTDIEGAHALAGGFNHKSLGVCVVGNYDLYYPSETKLSTCAILTAWLCHWFWIPCDRVIGHREAETKGGVAQPRSCPGKWFDMDDFRKRVGGVLKSHSEGKV